MNTARMVARLAGLGLAVQSTCVFQGCAGEEVPFREIAWVTPLALTLPLDNRPDIFVASDPETLASWIRTDLMDPVEVPVDFSSEIFVLVWRPDLSGGYIPGQIDRVTVHDRTVVLHEAERLCPIFNPFEAVYSAVAYLALPAEYANYRFRYRHPLRIRSPYDCGDGT